MPLNLQVRCLFHMLMHILFLFLINSLLDKYDALRPNRVLRLSFSASYVV